jgi:uncharacterized cupin superfamily protein
VIVDPATAPRDEADNGGVIVYLSQAGGLTQFGAYLDTLMPGAWSGQRHWHSAEDEFLFLLSGTLALHDNTGETEILPGDAICWRHGEPNGHHLMNRGDVPARFLIVGSRCLGDICTYPDEAERQVNGTTTWEIVTDEGKVIDGGDLPTQLLNLHAPWGTPFDGTQRPNILRDVQDGWATDNPTHPITGPGPGSYAYRLLSDLGGLTQFGAFLEELPPGSSSGHRHWHEAEDEMVYLLQGHAVLVEDTETPIGPGDTLCWPAGHPTGHRIDNRSDAPVRYLVIGTRLERDVVHYTDHDLITHKDGPSRRYLRRDGSEYPVRRAP